MSTAIVSIDGIEMSDAVRGTGYRIGQGLRKDKKQSAEQVDGDLYIAKRVGDNVAVLVQHGTKLFVRSASSHPQTLMNISYPTTAPGMTKQGAFALVPSSAVGRANSFYEGAPACVGHEAHSVVALTSWDASVGVYPPGESAVSQNDTFGRAPPEVIFPATYAYALGFPTAADDYTNVVGHTALDTYGAPCIGVWQYGWQYIGVLNTSAWFKLDIVLGSSAISIADWAHGPAEPALVDPFPMVSLGTYGVALPSGDFAVLLPWVLDVAGQEYEDRLYVVGRDPAGEAVLKAQFTTAYTPLAHVLGNYLLASLDHRVEAVVFFGGAFVYLLRDATTGEYTIDSDTAEFTASWVANEVAPDHTTPGGSQAFRNSLAARFYYDNAVAWATDVAQPSGRPYSVKKEFCVPNTPGAARLSRAALNNFMLLRDGVISSSDLRTVGGSQYVFAKYARYLTP